MDDPTMVVSVPNESITHTFICNTYTKHSVYNITFALIYSVKNFVMLLQQYTKRPECQNFRGFVSYKHFNHIRV